jgi:hypothetical protein
MSLLKGERRRRKLSKWCFLLGGLVDSAGWGFEVVVGAVMACAFLGVVSADMVAGGWALAALSYDAA